jgi:hypothetical protein
MSPTREEAGVRLFTGWLEKQDVCFHGIVLHDAR